MEPEGLSTSTADRVAAHSSRQRERGLTRVAVWVPDHRADDIKAAAARYRAEAKLCLPSEQRRATRARPTRISSLPLRSPEPSARPTIRPKAKVGRNQPCPCGSGKKFKRCCGSKPN